MELTINGQVYQFNFGMGFMREMNKKVSMPVDGVKDVRKNIGLKYAVAEIMDGDIEVLVDLLDAANNGQNPRVTRWTGILMTQKRILINFSRIRWVS